MASKSITLTTFDGNIILTAEEVDKRITTACRSLSRKKFTEKELKQFILNGKTQIKKKRTKSGYQLFLDDFRKKISKEDRSQIGKVAKDGAAAWRNMNDDEKKPYLNKANHLKDTLENANYSDKEKSIDESKIKKISKSKKVIDDSDESDEDGVIGDEPKPRKTLVSKIKINNSKEVDNSKNKFKKETIDLDFWGDINNISFTRFIFSDSKSNKFWEYAFDDCKILIRYGKIGSNGIIQQKMFENEDKAATYILKETIKKEKKGYEMDNINMDLFQEEKEDSDEDSE